VASAVGKLPNRSLPFQGGHVLAHRRLRQLERIGGAGEGAAGRDALQHLEPPDMGYQFH